MREPEHRGPAEIPGARRVNGSSGWNQGEGRDSELPPPTGSRLSVIGGRERNLTAIFSRI